MNQLLYAIFGEVFLLWAEAAEAVVHTTVPTIQAVIRIPADHTDHRVLLTDRQDLHTGLPDRLTDLQVLLILIIPEVHTNQAE